MRNLLNKKAQDMSVTTIIIIILAIVVLVFLIFGFTRSGGSLMDNVKNFFGSGSNIDSVKSACQTACLTKSQYEYETVSREVRWNSSLTATETCKQLENTFTAHIVSQSAANSACYYKDDTGAWIQIPTTDPYLSTMAGCQNSKPTLVSSTAGITPITYTCVLNPTPTTPNTQATTPAQGPKDYLLNGVTTQANCAFIWATTTITPAILTSTCNAF